MIPSRKAKKRPRPWRIPAPALLFLCFLAGCAGFSAAAPRTAGKPPASDARPCIPAFPDRDGWYGGDGAYSIALDSRRTLWLFGDTFVAEEEGKSDRVGMEVLLGNTVAISTCTAGGEFRIRYHLRKQGGAVRSFFGKEGWVWPQDPFLAAGVLYVPLVTLAADPSVEGPFPFRITEHRIARIRDFQGEDPRAWPVEYLDLTPAIPPGIAAFAPSSVVHGSHVYFYPLCLPVAGVSEAFGNMLARIPLDRLDDPRQALEYLATDGTWRRGLDPAHARMVLGIAVSEMSVRYHRPMQQWIAVHLSPENKGNRLLYQVAKRPEGPWSPPRPFAVSVPEVDPDHPRYHPGTFCYAGKEHIQYATDASLVTTYVCNSLEDMDKSDNFLRRSLFLYRPVVNLVPRP